MNSVISKKLTYKDYVSFTPASSGNYQLIDGEIIYMTSPSSKHQRVVRLLTKFFEFYLDKNNSGELFFAPMDVVLEDSETYQPDLLFILNERKNIIEDNKITAAPDLVIEVLSVSNAYYDLVTKKKVYESSCVKEYWIVDPLEKTIQIHKLENQKFLIHQTLETKGKVNSALLPDLEIDIEKIFAE